MKTPLKLPRLGDSPRPAHLVHTDGTVFSGFAAGARSVVDGEVVFNTSMTGYQEMLTDPSYHGQILCLTTSHVGQVGVNALDAESDRIWSRALVVQDLDLEPASWRSEEGVDQWLSRLGVAVGWGFDVRSIVRHIRTAGAVPGVLATDGTVPDELVERARTARGTDGCDLAREVACGEAYAWDKGPWRSPSHPLDADPGDDRPPVAVIDFGVKRSILRRLVAEGLRVRVLPPTVSAGEVLSDGHAGVVLSNGPGDPAAGSPGPFDKTTPAWPWDRTSRADTVGGRTRTLRPSATSRRRIDRLTPKSMTATGGRSSSESPSTGCEGDRHGPLSQA